MHDIDMNIQKYGFPMLMNQWLYLSEFKIVKGQK